VLVNCVGIFDFYRSYEDLDADTLDDAFDEIFRVNVKSHPALGEGGAARVEEIRPRRSCCSPSPRPPTFRSRRVLYVLVSSPCVVW